jgi:hypothetical protein
MNDCKLLPGFEQFPPSPPQQLAACANRGIASRLAAIAPEMYQIDCARQRAEYFQRHSIYFSWVQKATKCTTLPTLCRLVNHQAFASCKLSFAT